MSERLLLSFGWYLRRRYGAARAIISHVKILTLRTSERDNPSCPFPSSYAYIASREGR